MKKAHKAHKVHKAHQDSHKAHQVTSAFGQIKKILKTGDFSEKAIEKTISKVLKLADNLEKVLTKFMGGAFLHDDDNGMAMSAQTGGDSVGEKTFAASSVKASIVDYGNVSIGFASATSVAVAEGGAEFAATATFTAVGGSDLVFTRTVNTKGANFSTSTEYLVAIDFKFLRDSNFKLARNKEIQKDAYADAAPGNTAIVDWDVSAHSTDTFVAVSADALAIANTISSTSITADLGIG